MNQIKKLSIKHKLFILFLIFSIFNCGFIYARRIWKDGEIAVKLDKQEYVIEANKLYEEETVLNYDIIRGFRIVLDTDKSDLNEYSAVIKLVDWETQQEYIATSQIVENGSQVDNLEFSFAQPIQDLKGKRIKLLVEVNSDIDGQLFIRKNENNEPSLNVIYKDKSFYQKIFLISEIILIVFVILMYFLICIYGVSLTKLFFVNAILFGSIISLLIPLGNPSDENSHITTAYHYSNKVLGIDDGVDGIYMRECDAQLFKFNGVSYSEYLEYLKDFSDTEFNRELIKTERESLNVSTYFYTYVPQTIGITLGRLLGLNCNLTLFLGRFLNLLFYALMAALAIKIVPKYKNVLFFVALLPMSLHQAASFSYDALVFSSSFLLSATIIKLYIKKELNKAEKVVLVLSSISILFAKQFAYFPLAVFPILGYFVEKNFDKIKLVLSEKKKFILAGLVVVLLLYILGCIFIGPSLTISNPLYFFLNPYIALKRFDESVLFYDMYYFRTLVTGGMGTDEIAMPALLNLFYFGMIIYLIFGGNKTKKKSLIMRISFVISLTVTIYGLFYVFVQQTLPQWPYVWGIQGRYFTPYMFPIMICLSEYGNFKSSIQKKTEYITILLLFVTVLELFFARTMII